MLYRFCFFLCQWHSLIFGHHYVIFHVSCLHIQWHWFNIGYNSNMWTSSLCSVQPYQTGPWICVIRRRDQVSEAEPAAFWSNNWLEVFIDLSLLTGLIMFGSWDEYAPSPRLTWDNVFREREACLTVLEPNSQALWGRGAGVQAVKAVFEPTSLALWGRGAGCWSGVGTYLQGTVGQGAGCLSSVGTYLLGTVGQGCRLFKWCGTYLPTTVGQGCRLFKWCWNLPLRLCWAGIRVVKAVSEPTFRALWSRGAGFLSSVRTYLLGTVGQGRQTV